MKWLLLALMGSALSAFGAACAGKVADVGDGGSDASVADAGRDQDTQDGPAQVDCATLRAEIDKLRTEALTCCPFCNAQQCGHAVDDLCCQISITAPNAPAFSAAFAQFKASCNVACPATPCARAPSFDCKPLDPQNPQSRGQCL